MENFNIYSLYFSDSELLPVFLKSKYGNPIIELGGYRYNRRADRSGPHASWRCVKRKLLCPAKLITMGKEVIDIRNRHNHN